MSLNIPTTSTWSPHPKASGARQTYGAYLQTQPPVYSTTPINAVGVRGPRVPPGQPVVPGGRQLYNYGVGAVNWAFSPGPGIILPGHGATRGQNPGYSNRGYGTSTPPGTPGSTGYVSQVDQRRQAASQWWAENFSLGNYRPAVVPGNVATSMMPGVTPGNVSQYMNWMGYVYQGGNWVAVASPGTTTGTAQGTTYRDQYALSKLKSAAESGQEWAAQALEQQPWNNPMYNGNVSAYDWMRSVGSADSYYEMTRAAGATRKTGQHKPGKKAKAKNVSKQVVLAMRKSQDENETAYYPAQTGNNPYYQNNYQTYSSFGLVTWIK
jgi:hypothetical protein